MLIFFSYHVLTGSLFKIEVYLHSATCCCWVKRLFAEITLRRMMVKRKILVFIFLLFTASIATAQFSRQKVVMEVGTGTW